MYTPRTPSFHRNRHPGVKQNIRKLVWIAYIGEKAGSGFCYCCGSTVITPFDFECGHVQARALGGPDTVDNLRPICGSCNRSMSTMNMIEFQRLHDLPIRKKYTWLKFILFLFLFIAVTIGLIANRQKLLQWA